MLKSIGSAISQRESKRKHYMKICAEFVRLPFHFFTCLSSFRNFLSFYFSNVQETKPQSQTVKQSLEFARMEFDKATTRLLADFLTFKRQRAVDFKRILHSFVELQVVFITWLNGVQHVLITCLVRGSITHFRGMYGPLPIRT